MLIDGGSTTYLRKLSLRTILLVLDLRLHQLQEHRRVVLKMLTHILEWKHVSVEKPILEFSSNTALCQRWYFLRQCGVKFHFLQTLPLSKVFGRPPSVIGLASLWDRFQILCVFTINTPTYSNFECNTKHCQRHNRSRVLSLKLEFISVANMNTDSIQPNR